MNKLACLQTFVTVVQTENFSAAARILGVSKALVSQQISQLEEHIGVRLLQRTTRRVSPTSIGLAYYQQCYPLLTELEELDDSVRVSDANPKGVLRVTAPTAISEPHILPIVANYCREYPDVKLELELNDQVLDLVKNRLDVAIRIGLLSESTLVARHLADTRMLLCASGDFVEKYGVVEDVNQLKQLPCIVDSHYPHQNHWTFGLSKQAQTITVSPAISVNSVALARSLTLQSYGVSYLPSFAIDQDLLAGKLIHLLPHIPTDTLGIYAVYPHRKHLSAKVRLFIDIAVEYFQQQRSLGDSASGHK